MEKPPQIDLLVLPGELAGTAMVSESESVVGRDREKPVFMEAILNKELNHTDLFLSTTKSPLNKMTCSHGVTRENTFRGCPCQVQNVK
jgi:hypothetical protein